GLTCTCNCPQFEMVPVEWENAEFDAILSAASASVIVTEPAGNGSMDLDDARYKGAFDRTKRFSGAIMVGAGTASNGAPECWTNYGSRIDVHGWGDGVTTLHYGDLAMVNGTDQRQWYTGSFSGTSSATPIVAGPIGASQAIERSRTGWPLTGAQLVDLFRSTGTPQATSTKAIGPLPNLRAAIQKRGAPGSLISFSDQCLDIMGGGEFGWLQTYGCTGGANQCFHLAWFTLHGAQGGCVDVANTSPTAG